jgi:glycosyltransferase involved in cell wall biosynthesis
MPDRPAVSVVIATRDRPGLLERAVTAVLGQTYAGRIECLVVYDGVPVRTLDIAVPAGRRLVYLPNRRTAGLPGGRNTGCDAATGELLAFCDDDDRWHPDKLDRQVAALRADDSARPAGPAGEARPAGPAGEARPAGPAGSAGKARPADSAGRARPAGSVGKARSAGSVGPAAVACGIRLTGPGIDRARPGPDRPVTLADLLADRIMEVHPSTLLVPRATVTAAGPVDEAIPGGYAEDYEWLLRIATQGPIAVVDEPLVDVEWHGGSYFFGRWSTIVDALRYLLDRHPEFAASRRGQARIRGQIAFALAAAGRRRAAVRELRHVVRLNPTEKRLAATVPVLLGMLSGERVLAMAQARGRGV